MPSSAQALIYLTTKNRTHLQNNLQLPMQPIRTDEALFLNARKLIFHYCNLFTAC